MEIVGLSWSCIDYCDVTVSVYSCVVKWDVKPYFNQAVCQATQFVVGATSQNRLHGWRPAFADRKVITGFIVGFYVGCAT